MLKASGAKLFPWKDWDEWFQVLDYLYQKDATKIHQALCIISNWRQKMAIPVAVDSGAQLTELCWKQDNTVTEPIYSLALACAIVRFVNGMVDNLQESSFAVSVSGLASQLGLPSFVAEMRHDISHNALPCREALVFAAHKCLEWLRKQYFMAQSERFVKESNDIFSYLQLYEAASKEIGSKERKRSLAVQITKHVSDSSVGRILLPALVDYYLIPEDYYWNASVEAIFERWKEALEIFQQRWSFFVSRLYWYLFQKGWKRLMTNKTIQLTLIFGWLKRIIVDMLPWLSEMELEWMNQMIEFSVSQYLANERCHTFKSWLETASNMESTCKSSWSLLLYSMEKDEMTCVANGYCQSQTIDEKEDISSWTKCEQPCLDCPVGSIVEWKKANFLYKQTQRTKEEEEKDGGKPFDTLHHFLSHDLVERISQF